ncbi:MAG TPA: universal stress protein [Bacteroidales bacterium]|nr:universal stress protein [Bacteroidales bacterium]HQQ13884.1 universal stress protein [Bacteroidales bacterium]
MKQLLVAFDFSKNAVNTLEYALVLANKTAASLSLVWVDCSSTPDNMLNIEQSLRIETKKLFEEIIPRYEPKIHNGKINVILRKGKVYNEVAAAAKLCKADLVLAGTHGVSGFEQFWIGSNAYRIVTHAPCPVITIRGDYAVKEDVKNILLPIDSTSETRQKLPLTAQIASLLGATIHLAVAYDSPIGVIRQRMKSYANEALRYLNQQQVPCVVQELEAENLVSSLLQYAAATDADMISIMTEQGGTSGELFLGPYAQQLINNSLIPVLSLQSGSGEQMLL